MEEKITMNAMEMASTVKALNMILNLPGMTTTQSYWLDRIRKKVITGLKKWAPIAESIFKKYAQQVPSIPYIPPLKYEEFKTELFTLINVDEFLSLENLESLFKKYEIKSSLGGQYAVPVNDEENFNKEMQEAGENFSFELEFNKIIADDIFMEILRRLPGEAQLVLHFAIEESSGRIISPRGGINLIN
jgi:hypothetical protein